MFGPDFEAFISNKYELYAYLNVIILKEYRLERWLRHYIEETALSIF